MSIKTLLEKGHMGNEFVSGKIVAITQMGLGGFVKIEDGTGTIEILVRKDKLKYTEELDIFKRSQIGDTISVTGSLFTTVSKKVDILAYHYQNVSLKESAYCYLTQEEKDDVYCYFKSYYRKLYNHCEFYSEFIMNKNPIEIKRLSFITTKLWNIYNLERNKEIQKKQIESATFDDIMDCLG